METASVTFRAVIIEDESHSRQVLQNYLHRYCPEVKVIGMADSVDSACAAIRSHSPDLVFLDIQLKLGLGFDVLEQLEDISFDIVYTTAHSEYAIQAFNLSGSSYLLKPVGIDALRKAIEKLKRERARHPQATVLTTPVKVLTENLAEKNGQNRQIALPTAAGFEVATISKIIRCEANEHFTNFYLDGEKRPKMICRMLRYYDELLSGSHGFFRTHRSHLVNLNHVVGYKRGKSGSVMMRDGQLVPLTISRKEAFMAKFPGLV